MTPLHDLTVDDPKGERTQPNPFSLCEQLQHRDQGHDQDHDHLHRSPSLKKGTRTRCDNVRHVCIGRAAIGSSMRHSSTGQLRSKCGPHPEQGALKVWAENGGVIDFDEAACAVDPAAALT